MKTLLILARHGETEWNCIKKLQGHLNSPLTQTGIQQAHQLGQSLIKLNVNRIVTSPLTRAKRTAAICQEHLNCLVTSKQDLVERHFGEWQAVKLDQISNQPHFSEIFYQVTSHRPPQGESGVECASRMFQALKDIAQDNPTDNHLVISHGDAIRCFLSQVHNKDDSSNSTSLDAYSQHGNASSFPVLYDHQLNCFNFSANH